MTAIRAYGARSAIGGAAKRRNGVVAILTRGALNTCDATAGFARGAARAGRHKS